MKPHLCGVRVRYLLREGTPSFYAAHRLFVNPALPKYSQVVLVQKSEINGIQIPLNLFAEL